MSAGIKNNREALSNLSEYKENLPKIIVLGSGKHKLYQIN